MKAIIVDDDITIRENLELLIKSFTPSVQLVAQADGIKSGIEVIQNLNPDLVFLDVDMKDGSGFDLLSLISEVNFHVIFVTGHDQFAIKAFKYNALDYLLKPVDPDDLIRAVNKAFTTAPLKHNNWIKTGFSDRTPSEKKRIIISDNSNTYFIDPKDIIRCEAAINYTSLYLVDKTITIAKTLKSIEELLNGYHFFRCHQSHLINFEFVDRFEKKEGGQLLLRNGTKVPVAIRKREEMMKLLNSM